MAQKNEGFFNRIHEDLKLGSNESVKDEFQKISTNAGRVSFLAYHKIVKQYDLTKQVAECDIENDFPVKKNLEKARQLKEDGNKAVQKGDWGKAMQLYSLSIVNIPQNESEDLSILYANRSAALIHLDQHEDALDEIRRCLSLAYPRHLRYKVFERKAKTLLFLKRNQEAITAFQDTISALDEANKLDKEKRQKIRTDAKIMLEIIGKGMVLAGNPKDPEPISRSPPKPKLPGKHNPQYLAASDAITIDDDNVKGRYAVATRDIKAGEILLVEKPHSSILLQEFSLTHCQNCFVRCHIPLPCPKCPNIIYCSDKCLDQAQKSYHRYECQILPLLWKSGCSVTCHMALRMMTQCEKDYLNSLKETNTSGSYKSSDYRNILNLISHDDKRTVEDFLHRTEMAIFLVKLLAISGYFENSPRTKCPQLEELKSMSVDEKYKEDVASIGGFVLKNLQVLQFNAHEVFELQCSKPTPGKSILKHYGKSVFLGGAVFPTLALFNHSCDPGVVRYFSRSTIVVRAVKSIMKGEEVSENYGPVFTTVAKPKRQEILKDQYWFECGCVPCQHNWPLYEQMTENYFRFKCDSDRPCSGVLKVAHDCTEFMVQCKLCEQHTNIMKGLKSLQDTDMMFKLGCGAMEEGKYGEALKKFTDVLKLYDKTLAPPYKSYYDCVQSLRRCMLSMGNYNII